MIDIRFQYLPAGTRIPRSGYELTDVPLLLPPQAPIPRVGETVMHYPCGTDNNMQRFQVVAVDHAISRDPHKHDRLIGWTVTVTLQDCPPDAIPVRD